MAIYEQPNYSWDSFLNNTEKNINLQELNVIGKRKVKPLLPNSPLASNISKESSIYKIPSYTDLTELEGVLDNSKFQMYPEFNTGEVTPLAKPTDAYLKAPKPTRVPIKSDGIKTPPPVDGKGLSTIGAANIATGISTAANVATSIYGAIQASKMKPALMKYQAPTEAVLVSDNSNAIETAGQENIDKSINTSRSNLKRNGIVGMDGILLSKENEALNQLSGQLSQYRTGIDSQNAQIENAVNAQNKQAEMQVDQFNASTQNQFDQYKSSLISMGMKNATDAIQTGTETIYGNIANSKQMKIASISNQLAQINKLMTENPKWKDDYPNPNSLFEKKALLEKQLEQENNSLLG